MYKEKESFLSCLINGSPAVKLSALIMGAGHFRYGRASKGIIYLFIQISMILYLIRRGFSDVKGFFTLGTKASVIIQS